MICQQIYLINIIFISLIYIYYKSDTDFNSMTKFICSYMISVLLKVISVNIRHWCFSLYFFLNYFSNAIDRVVEDLIQEAISKGEFHNLSGSGKPLSFSNHNPMLDITTHNLNKILINNGYTPEWIVMRKDIM